jgi:PKD repeat protein
MGQQLKAPSYLRNNKNELMSRLMKQPYKRQHLFHIRNWGILLFVFVMQGKIFAQKPVPNFTSNIVSGCAPIVVQFTDISTNTPTSWSWDLGNGTLSSAQNPITSYLNPGSYTIKLIATNASGADSIIKTAFITVYAAPTVGIAAADTVGCRPFNAAFTGSAIPGSGSISSYEWNFGDGNTSSVASPTHTYINAGNYGVFLKVTNSFGCFATAFKNQYIKVGAPVTSSFTYAAGNTCVLPVNVQFSNTGSTGTGVTYLWNFGNGNTSTQENPSYTYTSFGNYNITLTVSNDGECTSTSTQVLLLQQQVANFTAPTTGCVNNNVTITVNNSPASISNLITTGDGNTYSGTTVNHTYANPGTYAIQLISDFGVCKDTLIKQIVINPLPVVAFTATNKTACKAPHTVNFQNASSGGAVTYKWYFGDGDSSSQVNPQHTYNTTGDFTVRLVAFTASGCSFFVDSVAMVKIRKPEVNVLPIPATGCTPYNFQPNTLASIVIDGIATYAWDFGDGNTSMAAFPSNVYAVPGKYTIKLKITTNGGCTDSVTYNQAVRVGNPANANFTIAGGSNCIKKPIQFNAVTPAGADTSFSWNFGDGSFGTGNAPTHVYTTHKAMQ